MKKRKCIFHYPAPINSEAGAGSAVRPWNIAKSFRDKYDVEIISGYGAERKKKIEIIKDNIRKGIKYDFMYSESLTQPMILSEKNHIPRYPLMDFRFFKFCKRYDIPIGLFYRDFHWKFPIYKENTKKWVPYVSIPFYKYELKKYEQLLDILYLPSERCKRYINLDVEIKALPPGGNIHILEEDVSSKNKLHLFYVGGIAGIYDLKGLFRCVSQIPSVQLTICCRKMEWDAYKHLYEQYLSSNIHIVHVKGKELKKYYAEADVACLYFGNNEYMDMAMPIKMFEYIGYGKPIISNSQTAAAEFIEDNDLGWVINYNDNELIGLLERLSKEKTEVLEKAFRVKKEALHNTWGQRIEQIYADLTNLKK